MMLSLEEGKELVKIARTAILNYFRSKKLDVEEFPEKHGIFVTLHSYPKKELRGCIGFLHAVLPLGKAVAEAAVEAAFGDPRFQPLERREFEKIIVEISVLTAPREIKAETKDEKEKLPEQIHIGKDGLICKYEHFSGLLLPQVATEHKMNSKQFLDCVCTKAGLRREIWKRPECKIYKFQAQIFSEKSPEGKIEEIK